MIRLKFRKQHRSILSFPPTEIDTDFVVLTGVNGAGKSHLLEAIENGSISLEGVQHGTPQIRRFHHSNMQPKDTGAADPSDLWNQRLNLWNELRPQVEQNQAKVRVDLMAQGLPSEALEDFEVIVKWQALDIEAFVSDKKRAVQIQQKLESSLTQANARIWQLWNRSQNRAALAAHLQRSPTPAICLDEAKFDELVPLDWNPTDVFQQNFAPLFAVYYRHREQNKINRYYATQEHEARPWQTDEEFREQFGDPPWEVVNEILSAAHLPLRVNAPKGAFDRPFELKLRHTELERDIRYDDLSSGEKIIISLAHCLYYAQSDGASLSLPQVLLLDEPDAPLHPTMAKNFMEVIENVLVKDRGVKVIMTTHSPSTVAFAPPLSVYRLDRLPRRLIKCSPDLAINVLTDGFATVMPSSRFVIVEAAFDQDTYQKLFNCVQQHDSFARLPPLVFVRASDQDNRTGGGQAQASNWAEKLSASGLKFFRGLLDRDAGNEATEIVHVLGRYSIENYLLDPICIYACLVEINCHRSLLDLPELCNCNIHEIPRLNPLILQDIVNAVCHRLETFRQELSSDNRVNIEYRCGTIIEVPLWLINTRGHDLAQIVRQCFKNGSVPVFSRNLEELVLMLTMKMPNFISKDLETKFVQLAS